MRGVNCLVLPDEWRMSLCKRQEDTYVSTHGATTSSEKGALIVDVWTLIRKYGSLFDI